MKLGISRALVVEGRYDAARLANLVEGTILTTDGFAIFRDRARQELFRRTARAQGLVILTDSDAAGFRIRHFVADLVGAAYVCHAFIPALPGKEPRKAQPGREGLLGVEGVPDTQIVKALQTALASAPEWAAPPPARPITYTDLYEWGLSGGAYSAEKRRAFLSKLGLPPRLSKRELVQVLNTLYTYEALLAELQPKP